MTTSVGFQLEGGRIPGERIATTIETSDSNTFTTGDEELASVTASLVEGRTYKIWYETGLESTAADTAAAIEILEDTMAGDRILVRHHPVPLSGAVTVTSAVGSAEFTAGSTADKTFVLSGSRQAGSGTLNVNAGATFPTFFCVDYIRG